MRFYVGRMSLNDRIGQNVPIEPHEPAALSRIDTAVKALNETGQRCRGGSGKGFSLLT